MSRRAVKISSDGIRHAILVGDVDLSDQIASADLRLRSGQRAVLEVEVLMVDVSTYSSPDVEVVLVRGHGALVALGWTPPEAGPQPTSDDPWSISYHRPTPSRLNPAACVCGLPWPATVHQEPQHAAVGSTVVAGLCQHCHHVTDSDCHQGPSTESN